MRVEEKKIAAKTIEELKSRAAFLSCWKASRGKKTTGFKVDLLVSAKFKNHSYRFCIVINRAGYPQHIRRGILILKEFVRKNPGYYPIIAAPFISGQGIKICDEYNTGYIDFSGNAKISSGGIYIHTQSKERPKAALAVNQSLFSPKASRITKLLLNKPDVKWMQKEIVEKTALSKGLVSRVINKMIEVGYALKKEDRFILTDFNDLFSGWVESEVKRRQKRRNYYIWARNPEQLIKIIADELARDKIKYALTQEAGASFIAPFAAFDMVSVYIDSLDKFPAKALSASAADKGFNVTVIEAPDEYIFMNASDKGGLKIVDNLQLYADLKKNPLRGEKQAEHILALIKKKSG